ncbi:amidase [Pusillimonas sp. ANT_WB101]|nr:amidase [Pusillimonas sp. ANT_WB101]
METDMTGNTTLAWPILNRTDFESATERVSAMLRQIQEYNSNTHIYLSLAHDALEQARSSDARRAQGRPLSEIDGLVFSVKDNIDVAGLPTAAGLGVLRERIAPHDSFVVASLRKAGAIILGKSNMHPAAFGASNHNPDFGNCMNPAHPGRVPGGSSGGAGASIAAGWADVAIGSDTMGSVRIPASYCGVVGFKPSFGLLSTRGSVPLCSALDHLGLIAGNVSLLQKTLEVAAKFDVDNPDSRRFFPTGSSTGPLKLRAPDRVIGLDIAPAVWLAYEAAVQRIEEAGWAVERFTAQAGELSRVRRAGLVLCELEMLLTYGDVWDQEPEQFPPDLAAALRWVQTRSLPDIARAQRVLASGRLIWRNWLAEADMLLLPTTGHEPFLMDDPAPAQQADLTLLANLVGSPAISIPLPVQAGALSVGLQLIAKEGHDMTLLDMARKLQGLLGTRAAACG